MAFTVNAYGQTNSDGALDGNFLSKYAMETMVEFKRATKFLDRVKKKDAKGSKAVQFPILANRNGAEYHTAGTQLQAVANNTAFVDVVLAGNLIDTAFYDDVTELQTHFDARSEYTADQGQNLARIFDTHILTEGINGARLTTHYNTSIDCSTPTWATAAKLALTGDAQISGGTATGIAEQVTAFIDFTANARQLMDERNVPESRRWIAVRPQLYVALVNAVQTSGFSLANADYRANVNGIGGDIMSLNGFEIIKTNSLPQGNVAATGANAVFNGDFSNTVCLAGCTDAVGVGYWRSIQLEVDRLIDYQGYMSVASLMVGIKPLRLECLIEGRTA